MMNATLRKISGAGNPHVYFDEEKFTSENPSCGALHGKRIAMLLVAVVSFAHYAHATGVPLDAGVFKDALYWFTGAVDCNGDGYLSHTAGDEIRNTLIANDTTDARNKARVAAGSLESFTIERETVKCPYAGVTVNDATILHSRPRDFSPEKYGWVYLADASQALGPKVSHTVLMRARWETGSSSYMVFAYVGGPRFGLIEGSAWVSYRGEDSYRTTGWAEAGKWFDLAFVMNAEEQKTYIYAMQEGGSWKSFTFSYPQDYAEWTGAQSYVYLFAPNWTGPNGAFHQFAVWERALSEDEVKEAFSWPAKSEAKVQIGYQNDSADEFASLGSATNVSDALPLSVYSHVFNATHPELTTTFQMDADHSIDLTEVKEGVGAKYAPRAQAVVCQFAPDSGVGELEAYVNGTLVGCETAQPGDLVGYVVPASLVTDAMTLKLKWKSGGDIKLDAAYVGKDADWQVGWRNNSCFDDGFAPDASKYRVGDAWSEFGRSLTGKGNGAKTNCVMTFSLTKELAERFRYRFLVRWGDRTGAAGYNGVRVNGEVKATQYMGWGLNDTTVTIYPKDLQVGDNTIEIFRTDPEKDYGEGNYDRIDYVRFEPVKYEHFRGTMLIVR